MPLIIADRVRETSTTTGTGTLTLGGAVTGFRTFGSAIGDGNTCYYTITLGAAWEIGIGTVGTGTLARTTVLKSSNSNSAVDFAAGTKDVFVTYTAERAVTTDGSETLTNKTLTDPTIVGTIIEDVFTITDGAAFEINPANGSIQLITLGASRTPKGTNFVAGEAVTLMVDDGTSYSLTWTDATWGGSGVVWKTDAGVAPALVSTGYTAIVLWKVGSQVYGARVGNA
jgi:hypothetical protein